jgi:hypothetical protein
MTDIIEEADDIAEDVFHFQPKPGGLVDRERKARAKREEAQHEKENIDAGIEQASYKAVKTAQQSPEVFAPQLITIQPGASQQLLPLSKYRYRATIILSTAASTVILCKDNGAGISGNGFPLASGIPLPVSARAQLYGFNPGGAAIQVGVLAELYAPEK